MFDAKEEAKRLKQQTKARRKRPYQRRLSKLDKVLGELVQLQREGCSLMELQRWLRTRNIKVSHTTISRRLQRHG